jgi:hypothetical protein
LETPVPPMSKQYDSSDPEQVKKQRKELAGDDKIAQEDLKALLNSVAFRRFVWRYLGICRFMALSYAGDSIAATNFNEGMRSVGNTLFDDIRRANPKAFIEMMEEARLKMETRKEKPDAARDDSSDHDDD